MAKVRAPLFGMDASGKIADALVFSRWKGRIYARRLTVPSNPRSAGQMLVRASMTMLVNFWKGGKADWDADWVAIASEKVISTFNAFTGFNRDRWTMSQYPIADPEATAGMAATPPADLAATGYKGKIVATWTDGAGGDKPVMGCLVFLTPSGDAPTDPFTVLRGSAYAGVQTATMQHLAAGDYRVTVLMVNEDGATSGSVFVDDVTVT